MIQIRGEKSAPRERRGEFSGASAAAAGGCRLGSCSARRVPPRDENVLGVDLEVAFDEEIQSVLRHLTEVQEIAAANVVQLPEELLESIGETPCLWPMAGSCKRPPERGGVMELEP